MIRRLPVAAVLLAAAATLASAQPAPFDMSPERARLPQPVQPAAPAVTPPASDAAPLPAPTTTPALNAGDLRTNTFGTPAAAVATATDFVRPIVPFRQLVLTGETDAAGWAIYLTAEQAASPATLHLAFLNALLVAPEFSTISVFLNDRPIVEEALSHSDAAAAMAFPLPDGLLRPGANRVRIEVSQRHRTDCTVQSTYELWTQVDPAGTNITFANPAAAAISRMADLRAVGVNAEGQTVVNLVAPAMGQTAATRDVLRLAQGLALHLDAPSQVVRLSDTLDTRPEAGVLDVVYGTTDAVAAILGPEAVANVTGPAIGFVPTGNGTTLMVTGRNAEELEAAVDGIIAPVERPASAVATAVSSLSWTYPEIPVLYGNDRRTLAELGFTTTEFSGRRFQAEVAVAMPYDLYAQAYGYATLYLDAAYSSEVEPGGHVDVYVNDEIAVNTPIVTHGGGIFRHLAVEIPLRHFRPGVNFIEIEAIVPTAADAACLPGATGDPTSRFVLFDTSEIEMPAYARAAQFPDLAALTGTGHPFDDDTPVSLLMGDNDAQSLSAAATFLSRLALAGGRTVDVATLSATAPSGISAPFGLYVGTATQMPANVGAAAGLAPATLEGWTDPGSAPAEGVPAAVIPVADNDATFARWRDTLSEGGGWRGQISSLSDWLQRTFDISLSTLRFGAARSVNYTPPEGAGLVLAQGGLAPAGQTSWTALTAPSVASLEAGTAALVRPDLWWNVSGQIATYRPLTGQLDTIPLAGADIVPDTPTPQNLRLVATNWLSQNLLIYGTLLFGLCIVLGIATSWLLKSVGRQPE